MLLIKARVQDVRPLNKGKLIKVEQGNESMRKREHREGKDLLLIN